MLGLLKSKTLLFNLGFGAWVVISKFTGIDLPDELKYKLITWMLDPEVQNVILIGMNVVLRFFTNKPLKDKKSFSE